jgi:aryl-alcohol dehydrogenase-like predicted oxidoreductase
MFAVRRALSDPNALRELVADLARQGHLDGRDFDRADPLGFVLKDGAAASIPDAAYRFCRDEPGVHVVLSGTGNVAHLEQNAASLCAPPLPAEITDRLRQLFAGVDSVSGN